MTTTVAARETDIEQSGCSVLLLSHEEWCVAAIANGNRCINVVRVAVMSAQQHGQFAAVATVNVAAAAAAATYGVAVHIVDDHKSWCDSRHSYTAVEAVSMHDYIVHIAAGITIVAVATAARITSAVTVIVAAIVAAFAINRERQRFSACVARIEAERPTGYAVSSVDSVMFVDAVTAVVAAAATTSVAVADTVVVMCMC